METQIEVGLDEIGVEELESIPNLDSIPKVDSSEFFEKGKTSRQDREFDSRRTDAADNAVELNLSIQHCQNHIQQDDQTMTYLNLFSEDGNSSDIFCRELNSEGDVTTESESTASNKSDSEDEEHDEDSFGGTPMVRRSRKKKRPYLEECIIWRQKVKKIRDHLTNSHKLNQNPRVKQFISTYYSTNETKRCYQCLVCFKRMSFKHTHPKHHKLERIFNRLDENFFPIEIQLTLREYWESYRKPFHEIVLEFDVHCQGLADDGDVVSVSSMSTTLRQFLGFVVSETKKFSEKTSLAPFIRKFMTDHNLKGITISNYLCKLKKFMRYLELHSGDRYPDFNKTHLGKDFG